MGPLETNGLPPDITIRSTLRPGDISWFLLHPDLRGQGVGRVLIEQAIDFCRESHYSRVFLWTESALIAAARLYESSGFQLTEENTHELWGTVVTEQRYELRF